MQSKALPDGVADFLSEDGKDFTLKLDKEGVYVYTCPPHRMMNMSGVIQVGKPVNKAKAQAVVNELENREDNSFFTQPVIFMDLDDFRELKYGSSQVKNISALVVKAPSIVALPFSTMYLIYFLLIFIS